MKQSKVISVAEAATISERYKREGKTVVSSNGCFDILHVGHVRNLTQARSLGDVLIVGVNSDASVRANKGSKRPVIPAQERVEVIAALSCVDYVCMFEAKTSRPFLKKIRPNIHVKGSDRKIEEVPERKMIEEMGGKIVLVPHTGRHSTTGIIEKIMRL